LADEAPEVAEAQTLLRRYGYDVEVSGRLDERTGVVLRAFQLHFRPACADGRLDPGTLDTLSRLVAALPVPALG
jgi:N-acetylmuramoyl-L-alanine amidase